MRDFFRFILLYNRQEIHAGVIITYGRKAFERWKGERPKDLYSYRANLHRLKDFLKGEYATVVSVPLWCIGIE